MQTFLCFDVGTRRTGVATGNSLTRTATPLTTLQAKGIQAQLPLAVKHIQEWQPQALVVGIPFHPDGKPHANTRLARQFAQALKQHTGLSVFEVDERYSTTEALAQGAKNVDAQAACIILEQFLKN